MELNKIHNMDCLEGMKQMEDNSVDCIVTDPPYGYSFMGKDWDKAVPSVEIWQECLRILKPGAFAFVMSAPRQDVLSQMIVRITEAGFNTDFTSIYWAYASGFPKAMNIGKMVDKRNGRQPEEFNAFAEYIKDKRIESNLTMKDVAKHFPSKTGGLTGCIWNWENRANVPTKNQMVILKEKLNLDNRFDELINRIEAEREVIGKDKHFGKAGSSLGIGGQEWDITTPATPQAKALDGSYGGFQPKPAVEIIIVAMKPIEEKTYVDQALKNGKGITWLDNCRIPYVSEEDKFKEHKSINISLAEHTWGMKDGYKIKPNNQVRFPSNLLVSDDVINDNEFSRYFDLDKWAVDKGVKDTFPFMIVPKAAKSEKNKCLEQDTNFHPTVKPVKLMSYLVTLATKEKDIVLDPFGGSGTTAVASKYLNRKYIGFELSEEYCKIANKRLSQQTIHEWIK